MNSKMQIFIKNFSYTLSSNIISLMISMLVILIVPKLIGVESYGYGQLYMFYTSYVGFFQFGWNDGIYLRYGGREYESLDKRLFFSQFWMLAIFQIILASIIVVITQIFISEPEKAFILITASLCMIMTGIRTMLLYIFQATNRIKEYAYITMMDRILYCSFIVAFLIFGVRTYKIMIAADLISKLISLLYAMFKSRYVVFNSVSTFYFSFKEAYSNINVGIKLMFANIASMLIIGVVRFGIESSWGIATFGKVSLTLSISNLMMLFINAIGVIMYPILKRTNEKKLQSIYITMREFLMVVLLGLLIIYYPLKVMLLSWLPEYSDGLIYMVLIFPICVYEGKMSLLINTYLKTLREEKAMLKINSITLVLSVLLSFVTTTILGNLNLAILTIVFLLAFRSVLAEIYLSKLLKISVSKDIILESAMTFIFILIGWYTNSWIAIIVYVVTYIIYLVIKRKDIIKAYTNLKLLMKS